MTESLQKSCLPGSSQKIEPKVAESTWVHRLFGGRLRSRVKCRDCGHPSDTFDTFLDLSIDIQGTSSVREALYRFIKMDVLGGQDKYKCEKCKKFVVAEKGFTIHKAPPVLIIHLKRFTPFGRKLTIPIRYDEQLQLQPFMSDEEVSFCMTSVVNKSNPMKMVSLAHHIRCMG
jgi:ubiquitin carboxyl-terminal hydrolase 36/42